MHLINYCFLLFLFLNTRPLERLIFYHLKTLLGGQAPVWRNICSVWPHLPREMRSFWEPEPTIRLNIFKFIQHPTNAHTYMLKAFSFFWGLIVKKCIFDARGEMPAALICNWHNKAAVKQYDPSATCWLMHLENRTYLIKCIFPVSFNVLRGPIPAPDHV